jgi:hypothetical protein
MYWKCSVILWVISFFCSCATIRKGALLYSDPDKKPYWVDNPPQTDTTVSFSSRSSRFDSERNARKDAELTALAQIAMYYGVMVQSHSVEYSLFVQSSKSITELSSYKTSTSSFADTFLKEISYKSYYREVFRDGEEVVVLTEIPIRKVMDDIRQYSEKISEAYTQRINLAERNNALLSVLREYAAIYTELDNPILQAVAYYGDMRLYDYIRSQIHTVVDRFFIDEPAETTFHVKKNDTITIRLNVTSLWVTIGPFEYQIILDKIPVSDRISPATLSKTIGTDNAVSVEIDTAVLSPGLYKITFEILLEKIVPVRKNITRSCYIKVVHI